MDRKLTYKKQPGARALEVEHSYSIVPPQVVISSHDSSVQIPSIYKKEDGVLSYSLICVISGGTDRERTFLNELERKHTFKGVEVIFVSSKKRSWWVNTKDDAIGIRGNLQGWDYQNVG